MVKILSKLRIEGNFYCFCDKEIHKKPTASYLTGERLSVLLVRSETKQGCLRPKLLFNIKLGFNKPRKTFFIHVGEKEIKLSIHG